MCGGGDSARPVLACLRGVGTWPFSGYLVEEDRSDAPSLEFSPATLPREGTAGAANASSRSKSSPEGTAGVEDETTLAAAAAGANRLPSKPMSNKSSTGVSGWTTDSGELRDGTAAARTSRSHASAAAGGGGAAKGCAGLAERDVGVLTVEGVPARTPGTRAGDLGVHAGVRSACTIGSSGIGKHCSIDYARGSGLRRCSSGRSSEAVERAAGAGPARRAAIRC
jgi:hypothetical protein